MGRLRPPKKVCYFFDWIYLNANDNYFTILSDLHDKKTKACELGCLFIPHFNTTKFGIKSFTRKCIDIWNFFSFKFNTALKDISRFDLKKKLTDYFINSY